MFATYILFSNKLNRFYTGSTEEIAKRIAEHNAGQCSYTSRGIPWQLVWYTECPTRSEAMQLEIKIKKRGAGRYLSDIGQRL